MKYKSLIKNTLKAGMKYVISIICLGILKTINVADLNAQNYIGNPVISDVFTADPCALVYHDTLFLFTGHDEQNTTDQWFYMNDWYVFSTTNMYDWENHGALLSYLNFPWCIGNAFAGHCIEHNGKFYWFVSIRTNTTRINSQSKKTEGFAIGVAVADHPLGPYKDAIGGPLINDLTANSVDLNIDPAVFIDDDNKIYLYWGSWGQCRMVELKDNMIELNGSVQTVTGLTNFFEAPFVHKTDDYYFFTYAAGYPSGTDYAVSSAPTGPWTYMGTINQTIDNSPTNHQAVIEFKNNWYFIYHTAGLADGGPYRRSVCIDFLKYDSNGYILPVERTIQGVPEIENTSLYMKQKVRTSGLNIYPNPLNGKVHITINNQKIRNNDRISIYSSQGEKMNIDSVQNGYFETDLNSGIYFCVVERNGILYSEKMIIRN